MIAKARNLVSRCRGAGCPATTIILIAAVMMWGAGCGEGTGKTDFSSPEKLAFISMKGDESGLYVVDADGGGWQQLLQWQGYGERFSFSNDGRYFQIALSTTDLVAATDGSSVLLTPVEYGLLAFSPDSTRIAFIAEPDGGDSRLGIIDIDTGETRNLVEDEGLMVNPTWVDDATLIYTRLDTEAMEPIKAGGIIYSVDVDTGATRQLTDANHSFSSYNAPVSYEQPFVALIEKGPLSNIWSLDVTSGELRQVSNNTLIQFRAGYLPGSNDILFEQLRSLDDLPSSELCVMADDGSSFTMLTSNSYFDGLHSFSPEGGKIAFSQRNNANDTSIWTMNDDGSALTMVAESTQGAGWLGDPGFARVPLWQKKNPLEMKVGRVSAGEPLGISITNPTDETVEAVLRAFPGNSLNLSSLEDRPVETPGDAGAADTGRQLEWKLLLGPREAVDVTVGTERLATADPVAIDESIFISLAVEGAAPRMLLRYLDWQDS